MQLVVDNSANSSPVLVKVYDLERRSNVRHVYVLAHDSITIDKLAAGKYEVRYQNVEVGGSQADCAARRKRGGQAAPGRSAGCGQPVRRTQLASFSIRPISPDDISLSMSTRISMRSSTVPSRSCSRN